MAAHKHSKKRDAILECVRATDTHPSAEWVYAQLKPQIPDLSLGTVYRNLAVLKQEGVIGSMGVVGGVEHFERNVVPHTHFICNECAAIIDVEGITPPEHLGKRVGCGHVEDCVLTFTGICNTCAESAKQY